MRLFDWWHKLCRAHRSDDETTQGEVREFLLPRPTRVFFIRATAVALLALAVFGLLGRLYLGSSRQKLSISASVRV